MTNYQSRFMLVMMTKSAIAKEIHSQTGVHALTISHENRHTHKCKCTVTQTYTHIQSDKHTHTHTLESVIVSELWCTRYQQ